MKPLRLRPPVVAIGLFVYTASAYAGFHVYRLHSLPAPDKGIADPEYQCLSSRKPSTHVYASIASSYDDDISWDEWLIGMPARRRAVCRLLEGKVIETAAGTGRNLPFIAASNNSAISSLTITDASPQMLERAFEVFRSLGKPLPPVTFSILDINDCNHSPASKKDMSAHLTGKFDTVVDTFGLCSVGNPTQTIRNMMSLVKKGGRIILLEHGRSSYPLQFLASFINSSLDKTAQSHADRWGCWWNRDLETAARNVDGLHIESVKRYHFGTTVEIVARKE
ncbi:hypothetical protein HDU82_007484 [Entophlyctis luteolus]|nr:hypothetical protein HDU82_007484 [Entophlyctis luteolus]